MSNSSGKTQQNVGSAESSVNERWEKLFEVWDDRVSFCDEPRGAEFELVLERCDRFDDFVAVGSLEPDWSEPGTSESFRVESDTLSDPFSRV